jgi:hypothetical protein
MLFDLRGRGRRRTVQVIYLGLAILLGGGLVLFGIGGATNGGLFDAINGNSDTNAAGDFQTKVDNAEKATRVNPANATAWAALAKARYQLAGTGSNFSTGTNTFTDKGKVELAQVNTAWQKYLSLNPKKPDPDVASLMVQAYSSSALNNPVDAVAAFEIVTDSRPPSANLYGQLAVLAFQANQTRKGELAEKKALSLADGKQARAQLKLQIEQAKQQVAQDAASAAGGGAASGGAAGGGTAGGTAGGAPVSP